jgi:hypothetical protein
VRLFVADAPSGDWSELTDGDQRTVRIAVADLQQARRARARIRAADHDVAVILDVTVAIASDFRSARSALGHCGHTVHYAGTVDGLAGLIADIAMADVADGVTLVSAAPRQDAFDLALQVLRRLSVREQLRAS